MAVSTAALGGGGALILQEFSPCRPRRSRPTIRLPKPAIVHGSPRSSSSSLRIGRCLAAVSTNIDGNLAVRDANLKSSSTIEWREFAERVSGEWDGYGADFSHKGEPLELPESVVPEAFREWEVKVYDWQTQCPTLAETEEPIVTYKLIRLLPTVGCEADAATQHSIDKRTIGGMNNSSSAFAFHPSGCYIAVWPVEDRIGSVNQQNFLELEHCLVDPDNQESRVRIILVVQVVQDEGKSILMLRLQRIKAFSEQWCGPFRNGDQLGGCAIREPAFASTEVIQSSEVTGIWESRDFASRFESSQPEYFKALSNETSRTLARDEDGLVLLPKRLWCIYREDDEGKIHGEAGWLLDNGRALTSRCVFTRNGTMKASALDSCLFLFEFAVGYDTVLDEQKRNPRKMSRNSSCSGPLSVLLIWIRCLCDPNQINMASRSPCC